MLPYPVEPPPLVEPAISLIRAGRNPLAGADAELRKRWVNGISYGPENQTALRTSDPCAFGSAVNISGDINPEVLIWRPPTVDAEARCTAAGWQGYNFKDRARRHVVVGTPKAVEHEFWAGTQAQASTWGGGQGGTPVVEGNLWLAMPAVANRAAGFGPIDLTPGTIPTVRRAYEILEQALADCGLGSMGIIHCRPEAVPYVPTLRRDGNVIRTIRDTIVVPGVGYPNLGPGGAAPTAGNTWMYATGMVDAWTQDPGDIFYTPDPDNDPDWQMLGLDRSNNDLVVYAHRYAMATWDGQCHFAVQAVIDTS